jgi:glycosyltransferase involved in cell wall biosynthesis
MTPLVSIVLPTHNGARYIGLSIQSCLDQTYSHWELLIVDDASTDETPSLIAEFAARDSRVQVFRHADNHKLPAALNTGFAHAQGEYLTWTSDDNYYHPQALAEMVAFLETHPTVGVVYTDYSVIDEDGLITNHVTAPEARHLVHKAAVGACFLYRREVYETIGEYDETVFLAEDYDFWLRASIKFQLSPLHKELYFYRRHSASLTDSRMLQVMCVREQVIVRHLPSLTWANREDKALAYIHLASLAFMRHAPTQAVRYWLQAFGRSPYLAVRRLSRDLMTARLNEAWARRITGIYMKIKRHLALWIATG